MAVPKKRKTRSRSNIRRHANRKEKTKKLLQRAVSSMNRSKTTK